MNPALTYSIYLLEQDYNVTDIVRNLCKEKSLALTSFNCPLELMSAIKAIQPCCIIAANNEPFGQALDLMENLATERHQIPVIILGDHNDIHSAVTAIKAGAIDYIEKPTIYGRLAEQLNRVVTQRA
ncbi:MAG: response regulator [Endozoicomonas sp.]